MRRPDRNIEIFSMSVLDMFASALGAFIMCSIILFPYYSEHRELESKLDRTKKAIETTEKALLDAKQGLTRDEIAQLQLQQQLRATQNSASELDQCREKATACRASLNTTFLVVTIEWSERCDVDLYIKSPTGQEFYYAQKTIAGQDGELSYDMLDGPGVEVWQTSKAVPGQYTILYRPCSTRSSAATIRGTVVDRLGRQQLPARTFHSNEKIEVATIFVGNDGRTIVRPSGSRE